MNLGRQGPQLASRILLLPRPGLQFPVWRARYESTLAEVDVVADSQGQLIEYGTQWIVGDAKAGLPAFVRIEP